ncbi:MAG TPA: hypothetical protein VEA44_01215 [Caulobacter sp.]|nr:hypothetical protein [Caulobacter sp.]
MGAWETLGIERTRETRAIRRAYAARLKHTHPEDDPAGFQALREAYDHALAFAERGFEFADGVFFNDRPDEDEDDEAAAAGDAAPGKPVPPPPAGPAEAEAAREEAEVEAAMARLRDLVEASPPASDAALALGLEALLGAPAMHNLDTRGWVEYRLARLILDTAPGADRLIPGAIRAFRWKPHGRGPQAEAIDAVFDRQAALGYLAELKLKRHPHNEGFKALSGPPPRSALAYLLKPSPLTPLRRIMERLDYEHPALADDFPHLEAWRDWLETPRLGPAGLWTAILAAPIVGSLVWAIVPAIGPAGFLAAAAGSGLAALALNFALLYGVLWPRRLWRQRWAWRTPAWAAIGWTGAVAILILAASLIPPSPVVFWTQAAVGVLLVLWCAVTGDIDRREAGQPWWVRLGLLHGYYLVWLLVMGLKAPQTMVPMAPALLAGGAVALLASGTLADLWSHRLGPGGRLAGAGLLLAVTVLALVLLPGSVEAPERIPLIVALAAIAVITARPLSDSLGEGAVRVRHWVGWAGLIGVVNLAAKGTPFDVQALCAWILSGPLIVGLGALVTLNEERRGR